MANKSNAGRLKKLIDAVTRAVKGDYSVRIDLSATNDGLDVLADAIKTLLNEVHRDITEHKRAEERLRRSEELLQGSQHIAHVGSWELDIVSNKLVWSDEIYRIFEIDPDKFDASYEAFLKAVHPEDREMVSRAYTDSIENREPYDIVHRLLLPDGRVKFVHERCETFYDSTGNPVRSIGAVQDITERTRAVEALREANETLQALIQASPVAVIVLDPDGNVKLWNPAAERMFGWSEEEALGRFLPYVPEDKQEEHQTLRRQVLRGEILEFEVRRRRKDGSPIDLSISTAPLRDAKGNVTGIIAMHIDITGRKHAQEERAKLEAQLLQAQKMESVGRLAGGVAHDFNNMLSVILGYAELMKFRLPEGDPLVKYVEEIEKAATRSRDTTRQLLAFSRKEIIAPKPLNLNALFTTIQGTITRLIGEDIDLSFLPGKDLWKIRFDPSQLEQILVNLVVNARDAMPDGGRLTIETANVSLDETFCRRHAGFIPGHYVLLGVSDNGVGMDKETLSHVFEPFFTTKEVDKGTGLGLATVYGIVTQNSGFINVDSEPGQGSTFRIYIPRIMREEKTREYAEEALVPSATGTILLVEDDDLVLKVTTEILETIGYTVLAAKSPLVALSLCENRDTCIDLVITDVVMPDMRGTELRNRIEAIRPGIKVLFMSGYTSNVIIHHGVLDEGVRFIQKPFDINELAHKVHKAIRGS